MPVHVSDRSCLKCRSPLVSASARTGRESMAFMLGGEIRRCQSCEARFICFRQLTIPSRTKTGDHAGLLIVYLALFGGLLVCAGIALYILRKFHRWPF